MHATFFYPNNSLIRLRFKLSYKYYLYLLFFVLLQTGLFADFYPNEDEVEIIVEINDDVTLGVNHNNAVEKANGEKIIILHNDMVLSKGFIETMDKHIVKGRITTYTRVEPPIYTDTYPGKVIADFGSDLGTFDEKKFNDFKEK